jgi:heterotetrameric sarcosine oxidase gamma subunit
VPDLNPITALGGSMARAVSYGTLMLEENNGLAFASLALRRGAAKPSPFALSLPGPGLWENNDIATALWTGPDQWLLEAPGRAESDFAAEVLAACPGCSVTEQTDGFAAFEIRSTAGEAPILALMAKLVNLDPARFGPGTATRTGLEHMSVFVVRRAADRLAVIGMRSAAGTLWHALETAVKRIAGPGA